MKILGMGMPELLIILVVILLIFGPKNLPKLGSAMGKTVKNLREGMMSDKDKPEVEDDEEATVKEASDAQSKTEQIAEQSVKKTVKVKKAVQEGAAEAEEALEA